MQAPRQISEAGLPSKILDTILFGLIWRQHKLNVYASRSVQKCATLQHTLQYNYVHVMRDGHVTSMRALSTRLSTLFFCDDRIEKPTVAKYLVGVKGDDRKR